MAKSPVVRPASPFPEELQALDHLAGQVCTDSGALGVTHGESESELLWLREQEEALRLDPVHGLAMAVSASQQGQRGVKEVDDLVVGGCPMRVGVVEDQEWIHIERGVHLDVEVEPVRIIWAFDLVLLGEAHTPFSPGPRAPRPVTRQQARRRRPLEPTSNRPSLDGILRGHVDTAALRMVGSRLIGAGESTLRADG